MKPYVISSPDYSYTSGGIKVMWSLYGWLLAKGQIVYMNRRPQNEEVVGIYPEIQHGNPAETPYVVRYILNVPGVMGGVDQYGRFTPGPSMFEKDEKLYYFSRLFGKAQDDDHYMFLPAIDLHTFKDQKKKRDKTCYLIGKGTNKQQHPHGSVELNRTLAWNQSILADLLNECHTLYCYDKLTAMMEVARLCGVKVQYFGDYEKEELEKYEPGMNGIGYYDEPAKLDVDKFRKHYISMVDEFEVKLDRFIEETQTW